MSKAITLTALDGANPLAFLAAVGTLRLAQLANDNIVRMRWERRGAWHPCIEGAGDTEEDFCERIFAAPYVPIRAISRLGKNITVAPEVFAEFVDLAIETVSMKDRRAADYAAAFGSEVRENDKKGQIERTDFCFITGSGHQHFIGTMEALSERVTLQHVRDALFAGWRRDKGFSMRWDPARCRGVRVALERSRAGGCICRVGCEPVGDRSVAAVSDQPLNAVYRQLAFGARRKLGRKSTWPIWTDWITVDSVRSLLSLRELLVSDEEFSRDELVSRGIGELYRSQRVRIGQGANFKVSFAARARDFD